MKAVILAGGKGTRLRPLTVNTPKPVVPVANRPFLLYQLELLAAAGVSDVVLALSYQPEKIERVIGDGSKFGVSVGYMTEPSPLGTAGAYRFAMGDTGERAIVFNGDILTDIDVAALLEKHAASGAAATLTLVPVQDPSAYGLVESDGDGRVVRFLEKPSREVISSLASKTINAGIYVLEPSVLDLLPAGENRSFEYDLFPALLEAGERVRSFVLDGGYWRDIGNPESYLSAHFDLLAGRIKRFSPERISSDADVAPGASVDGISLIGSGCTVKTGSHIENSVIGPEVQIDEKAMIIDSVIWSHSRIAARAEVAGAIIGRGSFIGENAVLRRGAVAGDKSAIPAYSRL